ncbi:MAG: DinB family protein [Chitinophagaceae bacterium]|nr:DinB family protein [Chitinophagaceae bacterium]
MPKPLSNDHAPYFSKYVDLVSSDDVCKAFAEQQLQLSAIFNAIPDSKADFAYAEGKWTVKQLLQHVIDAERIFAYRALWIARRAAEPLPGFDENAFAEIADVSNRTLQDLKNEFIAVRNSTMALFNSFTNEDLQRRGISNTKEITVNALGFITIGHLIHHYNILKERYL